jgi:hypothetical protein
LMGSTSFRDRNGVSYSGCLLIRIENHAASNVTGCPAASLDEGGFRAEKAFFVRIEKLQADLILPGGG